MESPLILYVEDDNLVAMAITTTFEEAGFAVHHVQYGPDALSALEHRAGGYQALVTDIRLPGKLDGWQIARRARELNPAIPVFYTSGDSAIEWAANGVPNSIMVQKPFANAQLVVAVTTLLNQAATSLPTSNEPPAS